MLYSESYLQICLPYYWDLLQILSLEVVNILFCSINIWKGVHQHCNQENANRNDYPLIRRPKIERKTILSVDKTGEH